MAETKYCRRVDERHVYVQTEILMARGDMVECNAQGNALTLAVPAPVAPPAAPAPEEVKKPGKAKA